MKTFILSAVLGFALVAGAVAATSIALSGQWRSRPLWRRQSSAGRAAAGRCAAIGTDLLAGTAQFVAFPSPAG
jgi:hypothetical protein